MTITISSREFNQDAARAKRAARQGPVFITDRGRPAHVLMTVEDYRRLAKSEKSIAELLSGDAAIAFEPPRLRSLGIRAADLDG